MYKICPLWGDFVVPLIKLVRGSLEKDIFEKKAHSLFKCLLKKSQLEEPNIIQLLQEDDDFIIEITQPVKNLKGLLLNATTLKFFEISGEDFKKFDVCLEFFDQCTHETNHLVPIVETFITFLVGEIVDNDSLNDFLHKKIITDIEHSVVLITFVPCFNLENNSLHSKTIIDWVRKHWLNNNLVLMVLLEFYRFKFNPSLLKVLFDNNEFTHRLCQTIAKFQTNQAFEVSSLFSYNGQMLDLLLRCESFVDLLFPKISSDTRPLFFCWMKLEKGQAIIEMIFQRQQFIKENFFRVLATLAAIDPTSNTSALALLCQKDLRILQTINDNFPQEEVKKIKSVGIEYAVFKSRFSSQKKTLFFDELVSRKDESEKQLIKRFFELLMPEKLALYLEKRPKSDLEKVLSNLADRSRDENSCKILVADLTNKKSTVSLATTVNSPDFFDVFLGTSSTSVPESSTTTATESTATVFYYWLKWKSAVNLVLKMQTMPEVIDKLIQHPNFFSALTQLSPKDNVSPLHLLLKNAELKTLLTKIIHQLGDSQIVLKDFCKLCFSPTLGHDNLPSCLLFEMLNDTNITLFEIMLNEKTQEALRDELAQCDLVRHAFLISQLQPLLKGTEPYVLLQQSHLKPWVESLASLSQDNLLKKLTENEADFNGFVQDSKSNRKIMAEAFKNASFLTEWNKKNLAVNIINVILKAAQQHIYSRISSQQEPYLKDLLKALLNHPKIAEILSNKSTDSEYTNSALATWYRENDEHYVKPVLPTPTSVSVPVSATLTQTGEVPADKHAKPEVVQSRSRQKTKHPRKTTTSVYSTTSTSAQPDMPKAPPVAMSKIEPDDEEVFDQDPEITSRLVSVNESTLPVIPENPVFYSVEPPQVLDRIRRDSVIHSPFPIEVIETPLVLNKTNPLIPSCNEEQQKRLIQDVWASDDEQLITQLIKNAKGDDAIEAIKSVNLIQDHLTKVNKLKEVYLCILLGIDPQLLKSDLEILSGVGTLILLLNPRESENTFKKPATQQRTIEKFLKHDLVKNVVEKLNVIIPLEKIKGLLAQPKWSGVETFMAAHLEILGVDKEVIAQKIAAYRPAPSTSSQVVPVQKIHVIVDSSGEKPISQYIPNSLEGTTPVALVKFDNLTMEDTFFKKQHMLHGLLKAIKTRFEKKYPERFHMSIVGSQAAFCAAGEELHCERDIDTSLLIGGFDNLTPDIIPALGEEFTQLLKSTSYDEACLENPYCILAGFNRDKNAWLSYKAQFNGIDIDFRILCSRQPIADLKRNDLTARCLTMCSYSLSFGNEKGIYVPFSQQFDFVKPYQDLTIDNVAYVLWTLATYKQKKRKICL